MNRGRFTRIEYIVALATLLIVGVLIIRVLYGQQIQEWEQSIGAKRYIVIVPLFLLLLHSYWQRSVKEARQLGQPVVRAWVVAIAALGILLACAGILTA